MGVRQPGNMTGRAGEMGTPSNYQDAGPTGTSTYPSFAVSGERVPPLHET